MATFQVDDVAPAATGLPTRPLAELWRDTLALGGDPATPVIDHGKTHPLLAAVGIAFAQHRPLILSPDAVWLTIAQGVAQHVRLNAEALRPRLVRHAGRKPIVVPWDGDMPTDPAAWTAIVTAFRGRLADEIGGGIAALFECDFSTSTEVERVASQIVLLDAYSPFFSYWLRCICGIPSITLTGTVADWQHIRERIDVIAELDLATWCSSLAPIADQFVRAAAGDLDLAFWRRIYNPADAYGGKVITGWITRLYPYLEANGTVDRPNPMLALPIDEPKGFPPGKHYDGPGLPSSVVPSTRSRVRVHVVNGTGAPRSVALEAGVVAVAQEPDLALRPVIAWRLAPAEAEIEDVVDRILADRRTVVVRPRGERWDVEGPAELIALHQRIDTATLFESPRTWRIRASREQLPLRMKAGDLVFCVIDLPDGRCIGHRDDPRTGRTRWYLCSVHEPLRDATRNGLAVPQEISKAAMIDLGDSLTAILDAALDADGAIDDRGVIAPDVQPRSPAR
jgi:hypothetical protein